MNKGALERTGHRENLNYQPTAGPGQPRRRRLRIETSSGAIPRPPYCSSMTKLSQTFLSILDECFPVGLRQILNPHTVQLSHRTMPSLAKIIEGHNTKNRVVANNSEDLLSVQRPHFSPELNSKYLCELIKNYFEELAANIFYGWLY